MHKTTTESLCSYEHRVHLLARFELRAYLLHFGLARSSRSSVDMRTVSKGLWLLRQYGAPWRLVLTLMCFFCVYQTDNKTDSLRQKIFPPLFYKLCGVNIYLPVYTTSLAYLIWQQRALFFCVKSSRSEAQRTIWRWIRKLRAKLKNAMYRISRKLAFPTPPPPRFIFPISSGLIIYSTEACLFYTSVAV